jgi:hypothetical protein
VAGGQDDLHDFADRAAHHLHADQPPPVLSVVPEPSADAEEVGVELAVRRSRARGLLPAGPALAAAALVGVLLGLTPVAATTAPRSTPTAAAAATYAELYRLHERGAPAPALRAAALELHDHVERLVEVAPEDPAAAEQALRLLALEVAVLDGSEHRAELLDALVETQRLLAELQAAVGVSTPPAGLPALEVPAPAAAALPAVPAVERSAAPRSSEPDAGSTPAPRSEPSAPSSSQSPPPGTQEPAPSATATADPTREPGSGQSSGGPPEGRLFSESRSPFTFDER